MDERRICNIDGQWVYRFENGRRAVCASREALEGFVQAYEANADDAHRAEPRFLSAWRRGVELAGAEYFQTTVADVSQATDRDQLRPDPERIEAAFGFLSPGQATFLAAMCSFFDARWGQDLLTRLPGERANLCDIAATLDPERQALIGELFVNYRGW